MRVAPTGGATGLGKCAARRYEDVGVGARAGPGWGKAGVPTQVMASAEG